MSPGTTPGADAASQDDALDDLLVEAARLVDAGHQLLADGQAATLAAYRRLTEALTVASRRRARPDTDGALAGLIDDTDRRLLRHYDRGGARATLPRELRVPRSEVNARINRLRALTGTVTMFQLGRAAHAFGWLDDPAPPTPGDEPDDPMSRSAN